MGDVVSDAALYLPFCLISGISAPWIIIIVLCALLAEMVGILGLAIAQHRCYDGPMGKSDRALLFSILALLFGFGAAPTAWLNGLWAGILLLQLWTIVNRSRSILREAAP
jgi:CDP-diacylglycerol---glycerol-3-phosphate 3-phosphatidyltransferase